MGDFIDLIESISLGVYFICGFFLIWNLRSMMVARGEQNIARYQLEREFAERRGGRSLTFIILMTEILVFVWATTTLASPTWSEGLTNRPDEVETIRNFQTSTAARDGSFDIESSGGPTAIIIPETAAPPSTLVGTVRPSDQREGCDVDHAYIRYPVNGMVVSKYETVRGTANLDDFSKYRFEIKSIAATSAFSVISNDSTTPVIDGPLGAIEPFNLIPGEYRFRLVVFNTNNQMLAHCEITIWIEDLVPTATSTAVGGAFNTATPEDNAQIDGPTQ
jgi:hypothetical protein